MICLAKNIYPEIVQYISKVQKAINFNEDDIDDGDAENDPKPKSEFGPNLM